MPILRRGARADGCGSRGINHLAGSIPDGAGYRDAAAAGGIVAATQSSDEAALQPAPHGADRNIERRIDALMRKMTLEDKLNQIQLISDGQINDDPTWADKPVGGVFSLTHPKLINEYQHRAMDSRLKIPILFAFDTIHGYRTIFPIPLGTAGSFDPNVAASSRGRSTSTPATARRRT